MEEEQIRTFVAIELPEDVQRYLTALQQKLKEKQPQGVKWVRPEGIHLTLKFLGNVPISSIPAIEEAIARGCKGTHPFSLKLANLGVFPNKNRPRVLWVGVEGEVGTVVGLQSRIDDELAALKFAKESRPFTPHLTLGRVEENVPTEVRRKVGMAIDAARVDPGRPFEVQSVSLMQSKLMRGGAIYSRLASIVL